MSDFDRAFEEAKRLTYGGSAPAPEAPASAGSGDPFDAAFAEAQRRTFESSGAAGGATESSAPQTGRSATMEALKRVPGLALRMSAQAVTAIPGMMADAVTGPINAGLDATVGEGKGYRFPTSRAAVDNMLTNVGVSQPQNAVERVVQDVGSMAGGAASFAKAGQVLAKSAKPVTAAVGEMLSTGTGAQVASGALGGGAAGTMREAGGSEAAQVAAGVVGALSPAGVVAMRPTAGTAQLARAAQKAHENGFVIPPADLNPGVVTEVLSGVGGKVKTAQQASAQNQAVTNRLAKQALGMADDEALDAAALANIRRRAAAEYSAVEGAGTVTPTQAYFDALDKAVKPFQSQAASFPQRKVPAVVDDVLSLKAQAFDAGDAIATIRVLRDQADGAYRGGNAMEGKALRQAAAALEDSIETHLVNSGAAGAQMLQKYREARQLIAKTFTVEKALNPQLGNVDAQVLARELKRGKPLTGELQTIAETAQAFPKATQALRESPKSLSVLDMAGGTAAAVGTQNPAAIAIPLARPAARAMMLSGPAQRQAVRNSGIDAIQGPVEAIGVRSAAGTGYSQDPIEEQQVPIEAPPELPVPQIEPRPVSAAPDPIQAIANATTIDEAIAGTFAAVDLAKPEGPPKEPKAAKAPAPPTQQSFEPVAIQAMPMQDAPQPQTTWYGRRGGGYEAVGDAAMAMRSRAKATPDMDWRVEQMPDARYRLAAYPRQEAAAEPQRDPNAIDMQMTPGGALTVRGDAATLRHVLAEFGIRSIIPTRGGLMVGSSQARQAMEVLQGLSEG